MDNFKRKMHSLGVSHNRNNCDTMDNFMGSEKDYIFGSLFKGQPVDERDNFAFIPAIGAVSGLANSVGGLFGGAPEDKSSSGYQRFLSTYQPPLYFPTKDEMIRAAENARDNNGINGIRNTYDQTTGTFSNGDWKGIVVSSAPISYKWFKGANEQFTANSNVYAIPSPKQAVQAVQRQIQSVATPPFVSNQNQNQGAIFEAANSAPLMQSAGGSNMNFLLIIAAVVIGIILLVKK
jgi:hypothetical protein